VSDWRHYLVTAGGWVSKREKVAFKYSVLIFFFTSLRVFFLGTIQLTSTIFACIHVEFSQFRFLIKVRTSWMAC